MTWTGGAVYTPGMKAILFVTLAALTAAYLAVWVRSVRWAGGRGPAGEGARPGLVHLLIGFVTNFFDTLGIGSFATTTSLFRMLGAVPDELIPGTLNVGHTAPSVTQAFIYIAIVAVAMPTLGAMIGAAVAGAWLGAGVVSRWSRARVQRGMGSALLAAAGLMLMTQLGLVPLGGEAVGLSGVRLAVAVGVNFVLGALMTLGIGLYAPCMILVSLLGMDPKVAFPIMMGSCAFLMPVGSVRFIREGRYALSAAVGLALGGLPAVLLAAYVVRSLPLGAVRWLVIVVVVYTAVALLRTAQRERRRAGPSAATAPGP
ncbi:MAG TPA: sulfite exporter TauE/SafE family protein [Vicinamibacteria bacterium]|nr:sulfite exporter TauE/SafE family protein [Vicinamibacteria bacterium]